MKATLPFLAAALAGCQPVPDAGSTPYSPGLTVVPVDDGLRIAGSGRAVSFGRAEAGALAALEQVLGPATGPLPCQVRGDGEGSGRAWRFAGGLEIVFTGPQFTGWRSADGRTAGIACLPRAAPAGADG